jgi:hypothetical protein
MGDLGRRVRSDCDRHQVPDHRPLQLRNVAFPRTVNSLGEKLTQMNAGWRCSGYRS